MHSYLARLPVAKPVATLAGGALWHTTTIRNRTHPTL